MVKYERSDLTELSGITRILNIISSGYTGWLYSSVEGHLCHLSMVIAEESWYYLYIGKIKWRMTELDVLTQICFAFRIEETVMVLPRPHIVGYQENKKKPWYY